MENFFWVRTEMVIAFVSVNFTINIYKYVALIYRIYLLQTAAKSRLVSYE
jgi:hypothetical protein